MIARTGDGPAFIRALRMSFQFRVRLQRQRNLRNRALVNYTPARAFARIQLYLRHVSCDVFKENITRIKHNVGLIIVITCFITFVLYICLGQYINSLDEIYLIKQIYFIVSLSIILVYDVFITCVMSYD